MHMQRTKRTLLRGLKRFGLAWNGWSTEKPPKNMINDPELYTTRNVEFTYIGATGKMFTRTVTYYRETEKRFDQMLGI